MPLDFSSVAIVVDFISNIFFNPAAAPLLISTIKSIHAFENFLFPLNTSDFMLAFCSFEGVFPF